MLFTLVAYHAGLMCAIFAFLVWSLPGAVGMFLLSVGVGKIKDVLPGPVYGLLSGLNASTVGIIALAAVQVSWHISWHIENTPPRRTLGSSSVVRFLRSHSPVC